MNALFIYGTLMDDSLSFGLLGTALPKEPAVLQGFAKRRVQDEAFPGIFADDESEVRGQVMYNLTPEHFEVLDEYEGDYYLRTPVTVEAEGAGQIACFTYVFNPDYKHLLSNEEWTFQPLSDEYIHLMLHGS